MENNSWNSCGRTYAIGREDWSTGALSRWVKVIEKTIEPSGKAGSITWMVPVPDRICRDHLAVEKFFAKNGKTEGYPIAATGRWTCRSVGL